MNRPSVKFGLRPRWRWRRHGRSPAGGSQPAHPLEASRGQLDRRPASASTRATWSSPRFDAAHRRHVTIYIKDNNFQRMEATGAQRTCAIAAVDKPEIQGASQRVEYEWPRQGHHERRRAVGAGQDTFAGTGSSTISRATWYARAAPATTAGFSSPSSRGRKIQRRPPGNPDRGPTDRQEIVKRYRKRMVVDAVSLAVASGEVVGLLGRTAPARPPAFT